jgi:hypothetical protein
MPRTHRGVTPVRGALPAVRTLAAVITRARERVKRLMAGMLACPVPRLVLPALLLCSLSLPAHLLRLCAAGLYHLGLNSVRIAARARRSLACRRSPPQTYPLRRRLLFRRYSSAALAIWQTGTRILCYCITHVWRAFSSAVFSTITDDNVAHTASLHC